jgi:Rad3-related DNA helicase
VLDSLLAAKGALGSRRAGVVLWPCEWLLDPKLASQVAAALPAASAVVFDEAHSIDAACCAAMSVTLRGDTLEACVARGESVIKC